MLKLKETVIVEGKYDQIRLSNILDAHILTTDGFGIFSDREKRQLIRRLAEQNGIVLVTDSDRAGFQIRHYISGFVDPQYIKQVYIPDVFGKESRKKEFSKEGKLGVEGIEDQVLLECFRRGGVCTEQNKESQTVRPITKSDLMEWGLSGGKDSSHRRQQLQKQLSLPARLSANALLGVLNSLYDYEQFVALLPEEWTCSVDTE